MGAKFTICCCWYYLRHNTEEKNAILRLRTTTTPRPPELLSSDSSDTDTDGESLFGPQPPRRNPRGHKPSQRRALDAWVTANRARELPARRGSDRELQAFISMRDQTDKATENQDVCSLYLLLSSSLMKLSSKRTRHTEEWEKLNYDIHTLRYARREVRSRWRKILLQLGYQCEADALLCVNRQSRFSRDQEHLNKAAELLRQLLEHTSMFPPQTGHQSKYLYVMDRLVSLDSAEDFVRLAKAKYPKKTG